MAEYGPRPKPPEERFWKHVPSGAPDECWEWQGTRGPPPNHYGTIYVSQNPMRYKKAHRLSWEIHHGPIPEGKNVLHHCDNPPCVNPAHLYTGTQADNARDRAARGRGRETRPENRGEQSPVAKLTEVKVRAIIAALQEIPRRSQESIAQEFGVGQAHVSRIMHRRSWAHLWEE